MTEIQERQDWYNIYTALRGPDKGPSDWLGISVKDLTTARFRGIVGIGEEDVCAVRTDPIEPRDSEPIIRYIETLLVKEPSWWGHWCRHTIDGAKSIGALYPEYMMEMDMLANMMEYMTWRFERT